MIPFVLFLLLLILLLFASGQLTKRLSKVLFHISKSHAVVIHSLSYIFLPGVILHELSHLLVANMLFVPTGEIEFLPEIHGNEVKMGSVAIAKTDPFRRFLIGVAPLLGGLFILFLSSWYLGGSGVLWQKILLLYVAFQIGNTMFSSRKDMEGALGFVGAVLLGGIVLQILGFPLVSLAQGIFQQPFVVTLFMQLNIFLGIALLVDSFLIGLAFFGLQLIRN